MKLPAVFQRFLKPPPRRNSLVGRLIRLALVWFVFALCVIGVALTAYFHETALQRFQVEVGVIADNLYADTEFNPDGTIIVPEFFDTRTDRVYSGLYWQISEIMPKDIMVDQARSRSLVTARLSLPHDMLVSARAHLGDKQFYNAAGPDKKPLRVAVVYSVIRGRAFVFMAGQDRSPMDSDVWSFAIITAIALAALAAASMAAIYFQVRIGLRPLFELTDELADTQRGKQQRLVKDYPAEIMPVARQINAFLDYTQDVVERQRTHVGNLAHALKTPLSVLLTSAGDAPGSLNETVRKQAELMRGQVDHHLRRARAAARSQSMGERTPVEPVLDELAVMLEQVFHDKGVIIDWRAPDHLAFRGERADLQEIAGNLLENACIWCRRRVRVTADYNEGEHILHLDIEDDGPGLDPARFDEVLKRGARLDESVPGSGLGLSIVDELVRAYGGTLTFERGQLGGLSVRVCLPGGLGEA
ncbi:MAG: sensor histidine kinase [Asticcacaulis sp.]